jgi:tetratricopeptide (TPR) repeat protein
MIGICNYRMGRYYYSFKNYPFAFEYLLRADNLFHELGYAEVQDSDEILYFIGSIYYETGDYDKAETFLQNIQQLKKINDYVQKQSLNTLALIRRQLNDTAQALVYFPENTGCCHCTKRFNMDGHLL